MGQLRTASFLFLLGFPLFEIGAHVLTRAHVPKSADFRAAASFVRPRLAPGDLIVAAPEWVDPRVREAIGDRIPLAMAGRSDSAAYSRLWAFSIRGARPREAPAGPPELERNFGRVRIQRWQLPARSVRYDFSEHLLEAQVSAGAREHARACPLRGFGPASGGGLGVGVLPPERRFACGGAHGAWVANVVMEDLDLQPRYCVFQPPAGHEPTRVTFSNVPLADQIVLYGGIYYEHERMREGGPVLLRVLLGDEELGRMQHRDGDGWKRLALHTRGGRGEVAIEVSAPRPERRTFCWSASVRGPAEGVAR